MDDQMTTADLAEFLTVEWVMDLQRRLEMPRGQARQRLLATWHGDPQEAAVAAWFDMRWPESEER